MAAEPPIGEYSLIHRIIFQLPGTILTKRLQSSTEEPVSSRSDMRRRYAPPLPLLSIVFCFDIVYLQNFPEHQFPSIVGRPILRSEEQAGDIVVKDIMCGDEAAAARSMLQISYPVGTVLWKNYWHVD